MNNVKKRKLVIFIIIVSTIFSFCYYLLRLAPFMFVSGRDESLLVKSFKIDQAYYREIWSNENASLRFPIIVFVTFVDQKQENPLKITIGDQNFDDIVSSDAALSMFGLFGFVGLHIDQNKLGDNITYDLSYLASLAFEQSVTLSVTDGDGGKRDYFASREINEKIGSNITNYYKEKSSLPLSVELDFK